MWCVQVVVQVTCLQPFLEAPRVQLRYSTGARQVVQELALPLAPHKFMVPEPHIAKEAFFDKWKSYAGRWAEAHRPRHCAVRLQHSAAVELQPAVLLLQKATGNVHDVWVSTQS